MSLTTDFPPVRASNRFARPRTPTEVLPGVTLLGSERINFFATTEGRSITLVDCGFYGHLRYLEQWLSKSRRRLADVEAVVITHGHADHLGFAAVLGARGVPVLVPEADLAKARTTAVRTPPVRLLRGALRPSCIGLILEAAADSVFSQPAVETAVGYAPDEVLDVPGRFRAVAVPGHSVGNSCLYYPRLEALFTGDTLMTRDPMGTAMGPIVFAEHPNKNAEAFANLKLLAPYRGASLMPAHGEPWPFVGATGKALDKARIV